MALEAQIFPGDKLVNMPALAEALGCDRKTALGLCRRGALPSVEIEGRCFVRLVDIEALLTARQHRVGEVHVGGSFSLAGR